MSHRWRLAAWLVTLGVILAALILLPGVQFGSSASPTPTRVDRWHGLQPELLAFEALKLATIVVASWLVIVSSISITLLSRGHEIAGTVVLRLVPRFLRPLVRSAVSLALAATLIATAMSDTTEGEQGSEIHGPEVAVLVHLGPAEEPTPTSVPDKPLVPTTATTIAEAPTNAEPDAATSDAGNFDAEISELPLPIHDQVTPAPASYPSIWHVVPGEHFWSIAEQLLFSSLGRAPTDDEIGPYWFGLIEANRSRLPDRDNPDLIYPGMQLIVTAPSAFGDPAKTGFSTARSDTASSGSRPINFWRTTKSV